MIFASKQRKEKHRNILLLDLVHEAGFGNFDEANSAEFLHCLVLT